MLKLPVIMEKNLLIKWGITIELFVKHYLEEVLFIKNL